MSSGTFPPRHGLPLRNRSCGHAKRGEGGRGLRGLPREFRLAGLAAPPLDGGDHRAEQNGRPRRLGQVCGDAELKHHAAEIDLVDRGQEHDRDRRRPDVGAHRLGHVRAVHAGHLVVEDDAVDAGAELRGAVEEGEPHGAAFRRRAVETPASQLFQQDFAVDRIVVDDQHPGAGDVDRHGRRGRARRMRRHRRGEPEDRAAADLALDADLAAHQIDQPRGDGEAEAGAFVTAGGRAVDLREFLEDGLQLVRRDADAGVLDA